MRFSLRGPGVGFSYSILQAQKNKGQRDGGWKEGTAKLECTPKVRQAIKGPATLNGGEQCWCPDKSIPVN